MARRKGGLEGVVGATSSITRVDGQLGRLSYRGIDIHDLAEHSTYEETAYLLWRGELPNSAQLSSLDECIFQARDLPPDVRRMIVEFMPRWDPMESLRTAVSALSGDDASDLDPEKNYARAISLTARAPVIVATQHRVRQKLEPVPPRHDMSTAANFLYMLRGQEPSERDARILDVALVIHADHELNASTFAARVAASTLADIYCAVTAAIGTLDGPLHGGANERVMEMLQKIGDPSRAEAYVLNLLSQGKKVPGFGHRVYKGKDPRATELRKYAEELGKEQGETRWYDTAMKIEEVMMREKGLNSNLDFFSGMVYHGLGIPTDLFTPIFAISRMAGWTAHILEQYADNRLIRPIAEYVGRTNVRYVPIERRQRAA